MICWIARRRSIDYVDGRLRGSERSRLEAHLNRCAACSLRLEQMGSVRSTLGRLPEAMAPEHLGTTLRVKASQERQALVDSHGSPRWQRIWNQWRFRPPAAYCQAWCFSVR
jgi:anti-sigma factor RsiW